jgi:hypothetical protein
LIGSDDLIVAGRGIEISSIGEDFDRVLGVWV